jgi:hypothetical protein
MIWQGSGVILALGGEGDLSRDYYLGGLQVAIEGRPLREGSRIVIVRPAWHVRRGARPRGFRAR